MTRLVRWIFAAMVITLSSLFLFGGQATVSSSWDSAAPLSQAVHDAVAVRAVPEVPGRSSNRRVLIHRIDNQHVLVAGRRVKVPFGTLPGTEVVAGLELHDNSNVNLSGTQIADPTPEGCPHRYFTFVNNFGAHNNQLLTLLNAFAVAKSLNRTLVVPPFLQGLNEFATRRVIKPERFYNFSLFRPEFCFVFRYERGMGDLIKHSAYRLFRVLPAGMSRPYVWLRPSFVVEREIHRTLARLPAHFTAVHRRTDLRNMYACAVPEATKPGFCHMRLDYIQRAQVATNHSTTEPFFLGTDNALLR
eukprot:RCo021086